jgi:hypothetical protein
VDKEKEKMATPTINIDLAALEAEIQQLSPEEIQKQLVDLRTKQRVNQSKHQGSLAQKTYMKKRAELNKLMAAKAKELGIYDGILATAKANADKILAERAADEADGVENESEVVSD